MPPRATPLSPAERRAALVDVTLPLLYEHGRAVSTRLIAEAAGVAEGTIFRAFATKDELVDAAIAKAFEPGRMLRDLEHLEPGLTLRERALAIVAIMQHRFSGSFILIRKLGLAGPPEPPADDPDRCGVLERTHEAMAAVFEPYADELTMPPEVLVRMLRLLTFTGTHPKLAGGEVLTAEQIVDTVLYGAVVRPGARPAPTEETDRC